MKIEIKTVFGDLLFEGDFASIAEAVKAAIAAKQSLSSADLSYADLRYANLSSANLSSANLRYADLRYADLSYADLSELTIAGYPIPVVENIDVRIRDAISNGGVLRMDGWHTCETTHCRAGWAIHLAGNAGYRLEGAVGAHCAGELIYRVSRPTLPAPDFFASDKAAMADIEACAAKATAKKP